MCLPFHGSILSLALHAQFRGESFPRLSRCKCDCVISMFATLVAVALSAKQPLHGARRVGSTRSTTSFGSAGNASTALSALEGNRGIERAAWLRTCLRRVPRELLLAAGGVHDTPRRYAQGWASPFLWVSPPAVRWRLLMIPKGGSSTLREMLRPHGVFAGKTMHLGLDRLRADGKGERPEIGMADYCGMFGWTFAPEPLAHWLGGYEQAFHLVHPSAAGERTCTHAHFCKYSRQWVEGRSTPSNRTSGESRGRVPAPPNASCAQIVRADGRSALSPGEARQSGFEGHVRPTLAYLRSVFEHFASRQQGGARAARQQPMCEELSYLGHMTSMSAEADWLALRPAMAAAGVSPFNENMTRAASYTTQCRKHLGRYSSYKTLPRELAGPLCEQLLEDYACLGFTLPPPCAHLQPRLSAMVRLVSRYHGRREAPPIE